MSLWVEKRLGDCVSFLSGGTPARDKPDFWESEVPWASNKDMKVGRLHDTIEHISSDAAESSSKQVPANSLLLVVRGMALAKMLPIAITQRPMAFNQDLKALKPKTGISGAFLYYWFVANTNYVLSKADEAAHGTKRLQTPTLVELRIRLPVELSEQNRIVNQLGQIDDWIENCEQRMKLLEETTRLIYTEWFVRLRFPGRKRKYPAWPTRPLKTIADINAESLGKQTHWDTLLYVDISSVSPGLVEQKIEFSLPDAPGRAKRLVAHGDIIWSCVRPNRRSHALILNPEENLVVSTGFATIRPKAVPSTYLYLAVTTDAFVAYLESHAQGVAYPAVTGRDFEKAEILLPPPEILEQFDQLTKPIFEQIETLKSQIEKLRQARDLLLPRLISGQLRL